MQKIYTRWAPSLGALEGTHQEAWGTEDYNPSLHKWEPTVFFGLYDVRDYLALKNHRGKAWVLWAGSDILNLTSGFLFNDGKLGMLSRWLQGVSPWLIKGYMLGLLKKAEHWVENKVEANALLEFGVAVTGIMPSFMGRLQDYYYPSFIPRIPSHVYISGHEGRESEYGFTLVQAIAQKVPECRFHLYGSDKFVNTALENVFVHGRIAKGRMNRQISGMQCGLRLNSFDGFSEITAKSVLMGQYPITWIPYPHIDNAKSIDGIVELLKKLPEKTLPNNEARLYYMQRINKYPWVKI